MMAHLSPTEDQAITFGQHPKDVIAILAPNLLRHQPVTAKLYLLFSTVAAMG
jgi:hypothetical protein